MINKVFAQVEPTSILGGKVDPPTSPLFSGGFAGLASSLLRIVYIVAGLYVFFNFIIAGYKFISAGGNPEAINEAWGTIWKSLVGLLLIVSATVFAALVGWLFLDNPTAILKPQFVAPTP